MRGVDPQSLTPEGRRLLAHIERLETAWTEGTLERVLDSTSDLPPGLSKAYGKLLQSDLSPSSQLRREGLPAALRPLTELLGVSRQEFQGELEVHESLDRALVHITVEPGRTVSMSVNRMMDAAYWGIGVQLDSEGAAWYRKTLTEVCEHRLGVDLVGLMRVEGWLRQRPRRKAPFTMEGEGRKLEHLLRDILNAGGMKAHLAPLAEDFLEKTDLRVYIPGVRRSRGARVQVTSTTTPHRLQGKTQGSRGRELTVLSPRHLADAVAAREGLLTREEEEAFWNCLPSPTAMVEELAAMIRTLLEASWSGPLRHPSGPAAEVPEPLCKLIQQYVRRDAGRATRALRDRQSKNPKSPPH